MNLCFAAAGALAFLVGLVHSVGGELLLFRRLTKDSLPPVAGSTDFSLRMMWVTWHVPTALGWGFAAILLWLSLPSSPSTDLPFLQGAVACSFLASSLIVLVGTKGKHPGWVGLLGVAILTWLGGM